MTTTAKQQAILDIKEDLGRQHKCFIAFHRKLNPAIERLVKAQIYMQEMLNRKSTAL